MRRATVLSMVVTLGTLIVFPTTGAGAAQSDRRSHVITAPTRTTYTIDGKHVAMACRVSGRMPVVFLAGGNDPGIYWNDLVTALGPKTLTCVFDRPGVGASDPTRLRSPPSR